MATAQTNRTEVDAPQKSRLLDSDAPAPSAPQGSAGEPQYVVDGKAVSLEAYMEALPKAGYVPERMPANFFPALSTK